MLLRSAPRRLARLRHIGQLDPSRDDEEIHDGAYVNGN
jgi:hypothetical protein